MADAAAESRSRLLVAAGLGLKVGIKDKVVGGGRVPRSVGPAPAAWTEKSDHNCPAICQGWGCG